MRQEKAEPIPAITTDQMREVDRLMIDFYGIQLIQMMENAGRNLADLSKKFIYRTTEQPFVVVLCGAGNNGGGGMVAARNLHNHGYRVAIQMVADFEKLKDIPRLQWNILQNMEIAEANMDDLSRADLIIDAMLGYGIKGNPRFPIDQWIIAVNASKMPVISLDTPSGLDTTSGVPGKPCILARATMTLALPKIGLLKDSAKANVGTLFLADISVPPSLYQKMGLDVRNIFEMQSVLQINGGEIL